MKNKSDALKKFKEYLAEAEWQTGCRLKMLWTDGGGKYFSSDFISHLKSVGITHELMNPHTPQENSVAERVNWTLVTMAIVMLKSIESKISCTAWPYTIQHATLIKNISLHSSLPDSTSPYERYTGNKLDNHSIPGIHIGIALGKKAFLVYDPHTCISSQVSGCHGMTSALRPFSSLLPFAHPLLHLHHLPPPSHLVHFPSASSTPTLLQLQGTLMQLCYVHSQTSLRLMSDLLRPGSHAKGHHLYTPYNLSDPFFITNNR